ncbi:Phosphopantetheine adenylyltransferase [Frankliniella fusca]|uniref:Phosphopantetheine adenylyltransferase n=1 Tax=Frankliniella fusca TaxID=407009 RepID=A0AAE1LUK2_9NEOP|nr:Phosphopantetheine adenylyltransferase [Frankliniella fusca]
MVILDSSWSRASQAESALSLVLGARPLGPRGPSARRAREENRSWVERGLLIQLMDGSSKNKISNDTLE